MFVAVTACYLAAAAYLTIGHNLVEGDAISRVGSAYWVLFSRDPHLAAIGFVWNPLPALAMLPIILLKGYWPDLTTIGFASNIVSAPFMGGMVYQANRYLLESRVSRTARLWITLLLALHPLILYHGANGLSEAPTLFFLVFATRYFARWLRTGDLAGLVLAGVGLGGAYLARYEAAVAAAAVLTVVALVSVARAPRGLRARLVTGACDVAIAAGPFALTFAYWTAASWIITGHPFEQFSSVYGNSSQARYWGVPGSPTHLVTPSIVPASLFPSSGLAAHLLRSAATQALARALLEQPVLPLAVLVGLVSLWRRRDWATLAAPALLGAPLLFAIAAVATGLIGPDNRYLIWGVPLGFLMMAEAIPRTPGPGRAGLVAENPRRRQSASPRPVAGLATLAVVALLVPSLPLTARLMLDPNLSHSAPAIHLVLYNQGRTPEYTADAAVAAYLDGLHLHDGTVLVDVFTGYPIVLKSRNPHQFVITSDRDFNVVLADPAGWGVTYLLVPRGNPLDALIRTYPGIYNTGGGVGTLVREFRSPGDPDVWRLYRVGATPTAALSSPSPSPPARPPSPSPSPSPPAPPSPPGPAPCSQADTTINPSDWIANPTFEYQPGGQDGTFVKDCVAYSHIATPQQVSAIQQSGGHAYYFPSPGVPAVFPEEWFPASVWSAQQLPS